jgi:hypothetical protein
MSITACQFVGSFDEDAVLELRAGSDQRDEVGGIDGTPWVPVLCRKTTSEEDRPFCQLTPRNHDQSMRNDSVLFSAYNEGDRRALLRKLLSRSDAESSTRSAERILLSRRYRIPKKVEGMP